LITKRSIQQVLETAKVEDVIKNFVNLRRRGANFIGLCPFHDEKTPSFVVSPSKNIYKCFGCGKAGGAVNFIMDHEGYSFIEAIRFLADMYNIQLEEVEMTDDQVEAEKKRDSLFIVNEWAKKRFKNNLFNTREGVNIGLAYFKERGYRENIIEKFDLGYARSDPRDLLEAAKREGYKEEYLEELGLISSKGTDFFRNRVIFTIHNLTGKAIGFAGRTMSTDKNLPKYINSPESEIYNKRKTLYGLYFAKNAIRKEDRCFLVEGYTDVLSLVQAGIENVVASSGTSLTQEQIRLIKRYSNNILLLYDGDKAGINAAMRGMDLILAEDMIVKLVILPPQHDPDSFIKESGREEFLQYVKNNETDFVLFKTRRLLNETEGDPVKKASILKDIVNTLAKIPDPLNRTMYIKECASILDVDEKIIVNETNKVIKKELKEKRRRKLISQQKTELKVSSDTSSGTEETASPQDIVLHTDVYQEKEIVKVLMEKGAHYYDKDNEILVVDFILHNITDLLEYFDSEEYKNTILYIKELREKGIVPDESTYLTAPEYIKNIYIELVLTPYIYANWAERGIELQTQKYPSENHVKETEQAIMLLNFKKIKKLINLNKEKLEKTDKDSQEFKRLLAVNQKLIETKKEIADKLGLVTA